MSTDGSGNAEETSLWKRFQSALLTAVSKRFSCYILLSFSLCF